MSEYPITEQLTNPVPATAVGGSITTLNLLGLQLPDLLNIGFLVYVFLLITHKIWVMYREYKDGIKK